jgi:hypothetical protein
LEKIFRNFGTYLIQIHYILVSFYDFSFYDPVLLEPNPVVKRVLPVNLRHGASFIFSSDSWPLKMWPIRCPETSVNNYHTTPRNIPKSADLKLLKWLWDFSYSSLSHFLGKCKETLPQLSLREGNSFSGLSSSALFFIHLVKVEISYFLYLYCKWGDIVFPLCISWMARWSIFCTYFVKCEVFRSSVSIRPKFVTHREHNLSTVQRPIE